MPPVRALLRIRLAHVPVGHQVVAVRIGVDEEDDDVVQDPHRLRIGAAHHLVDHLAELLRAEHFGGVQPAVDPDDGLALARQRSRRVVRESLGEREPHGDLPVALEIAVILRRRHDRHEVRPALGRLADLLDDHAIGLRVQLAPVRRDLLVVGQEVVVAEVVPEFFLRSGDPALADGRRERDNR